MITFTSDSSQKRADDLVARIAALNNGSAAATVKADLRLLPSPQKIVDATLAAFSTPHIHILVNNAGVEQNRLITDVSALLEQLVMAQSEYFYGHAMSSVAGGVVNMRAARGVDSRTYLID